jgi:hypothetical protein
MKEAAFAPLPILEVYLPTWHESLILEHWARTLGIGNCKIGSDL